MASDSVHDVGMLPARGRIVLASILLCALAVACSPAAGLARQPGDNPRDTDGGDGTGPLDADGDGHDSIESGGDDCDDTDPTIQPGAEDVCDGLDNDCDGLIEEDAPMHYADLDGDGYGDPGAGTGCNGVGPANGSDCDDSDSLRYPGSDERCNDADDDCDGLVDEGLSTLPSFLDSDGDGAGDPDRAMDACNVPAGSVDNDWDCDDSDPISPVWVAVSGRSGALGTVEDPVGTIQSGIDLEESCVLVLPGDYWGSIDFHGVETAVYSAEGEGSTWIHADGGPAVTFQSGEGAGTSLKGFSISGSEGVTFYASEVVPPYEDNTTYYYEYTYVHGGGIFISAASPTLMNLTITGCVLPIDEHTFEEGADGYSYYMYYTYGFGGGLYATLGSPTLTDVTVTGNQGTYGAGMWFDGYNSVRATRLEVSGNYGSRGAAFGLSGEDVVEIQNLIVNANIGGCCTIDVGHSASLEVDHATIVGNTYGIYSAYATAVTLTNSIVAWNDVGVYDGGGNGSATDFDLRYNDSYANTWNYYGLEDPPGPGSIQADPQFTTFVDNDDWADDVLTLATSSPCVDVGDPSGLDADGSRADVGAYGGSSAW